MMFFLLLLSGIFACTGKFADASCNLKMSPPRVFVRYGDSMAATCSSTSEIEGMGWESTYGGTGLKKGVSSVVLNITSVETWELEPQCYASLLSDGSQCIDNLPVTVYKQPKSVSMSQSSSERGPMVEGQDFEMTCDIVNVAPVNKLLVNWYREQSIIYIETFDDPGVFPVDKSSVLSMTAHRNDNGAHFRCEAKFNFESVKQSPPPIISESKQLNVLYPPTFDQASNETVDIVADEKISLNCTAAGNPKPVYRWDFQDPNQETNKQQNVSEPIFTPVSKTPGTYICTVSNSQGASIKYFSVKGSEDQTTFAAILGVFLILGVLFLISGLFIVTPNGTFSCSKNNYIRGQPTSSGPV